MTGMSVNSLTPLRTQFFVERIFMSFERLYILYGVVPLNSPNSTAMSFDIDFLNWLSRVSTDSFLLMYFELLPGTETSNRVPFGRIEVYEGSCDTVLIVIILSTLVLHFLVFTIAPSSEIVMLDVEL
jgi:hypothetical protein